MEGRIKLTVLKGLENDCRAEAEQDHGCFCDSAKGWGGADVTMARSSGGILDKLKAQD